MCTVTVVPIPDASPAPGVRAKLTRMVCNRDELRTRAPGLPPLIRRFGARQAIMPVDVASGGTWVAVSDSGLAMTLLNVYPQLPADARAQRERPEDELLSRGAIIPSLLHLADLEAVVGTASRLKARQYPPFRFLVADRWGAVELRAEGGELLKPRRWTLAEPLMFTSSGLGDWRVEAPRRGLFEQMLLAGKGDWVARQDAFHRHRWPDRPELSVCMSRAEARTVSRTVIEIGEAEVALAYAAVDPDQGVESKPVRLALPVSTVPSLASRGSV